jgi:mono/diheme cytochrome c family protein
MPTRATTVGVMVVATVFLTVVVAKGRQAYQAAPAEKPNPDGWQLPPNADDEKNPIEVSPVVLNAGEALFKKKCERCHGPEGHGDGPDADPDYMDDMDLTNPKRADRNSDGVVFYKVWNGRRKPKMPPFKEELTKDQAWTVVAYAQTLRKPAK